MPDLSVQIADPLAEDSLAILRALDRDLLVRYPCGSIHGFDPKDIASNGVFVLARSGNTVAGCGALRPFEGEIVEIKRMFVAPEFRGRGFSRVILRKLESEAALRGFSILRLEAGSQQPEALKLYETSGYARIEAFGEYVGDPLSLCYEKRLDP